MTPADRESAAWVASMLAPLTDTTTADEGVTDATTRRPNRLIRAERIA